MSWEEYKKKRQESTNTEKANNNELSSWEKYKQQRENEITVSNNEIKKENKTFWQEMKDRTEKRLQESRNNREKTIKNQIKNSISNIKNSMSNQEETLPRATEKNIINSISKISKQGGLNNYMEGKTLNEVSDVDEILKESINNIKNGNVVKASSAFEDGYQFGDVTKTVLSTGADTALNVGKGIMNIGEGIGDLVTYGIAGVADLTGNDEYANQIRYNASHRNVVDEIMSPIIEKVDKNSVFGDKIDEINQGLGYIAGNTAISYLTGGVGNALGLAPKGVKVAQTAGSMATTFSSSMGHGMTEAYQGGATDDEAFAYGLVSALGETGSELMFGGLGKATEAIGLSKGALDDAVIGGLTKNIKDKMAKTLMQSGLKAGGEGAEEVVSGFVSAIGKKLTYMSEEDLKEIIKNENLAEQFWMGTLTSAIAQSRSTMASVKNGTDYITREKYNDIAKNNTSELTQNVQNNEGQQTILNDIKMPQNQNKPQLDDMLNNKELPMQKYVYEKSNNIKINNLRQDANKYFNNSEKAHNYMQMLEKIIEDKNIDIRSNADLKTPDGRIVNGSYSNGIITINPNSTRAGEFIAIHELTHAIGTKEMLDIVNTYRKSNAEFDSAVRNLLQNYNETEITEEALADVSAQLFGNQEFINNMAQNNPNIFQKIYSEIKYLWHQFRGYKNQNQFVEDLYYKWTQAYNSNNKLNNATNYYIETVAGFNEMEYNNVIEETLNPREYAILKSIINSDNNIKPGINYIDVTNGRYIVYYKGFDDFKVMSRKVDADAGRIGERNDRARRKTRYSKTLEQSIRNKGTTASNDEISNFNQTGKSERSGSNTSSSTNIKNIKYSIQESENNAMFEDGEALFVNKNGEKENIYFRFDDEGGFRGKEHESGVSMWEDYVDDLIYENYDSETKTNKFLEDIFDTTQEEYDNMNADEQMQLKREIAKYKGYITEGASVFSLSDDGMSFFESYDSSHGLTDYAEVNFFTGEENGYGADGEDIVIPDKELLKLSTKDFLEIRESIEDELFDDDKFEMTSNKEFDEEVNDRLIIKIIKLINEKKYSQNNPTWQQYLDKNFKSTGTRTDMQDILVPKANNEGSFSKNNIANNQEEVYNNNESESGINENSRGIEQDDKRRVQELFKEYQRRQNNGATNSQELRGNQIQQNVTENTIKQGLINYADKYQKNNLTEKENKLKNIINKLGGDVIFYEYGNENFYQGLANNEKFYIDTLGESSVENVFYHELTHYLRQNNNKIYNNEIQPIVNEIASDYNYQEAIFNYANSSEDFDVRKLVANRQMELAEEVVADYVASFYGDLQVDYGLPVEMEQQIRSAMDKILNVNDTLQYQNVVPSVENNVLDTGEYTKQKNKILNPTEIANLNMQDANTTPKLKQKNYAKGNKQSSFLSNIVTDAKFLNEDLRQEMSKEDNIKYYKGITNKGTLESAYKKLQENGQNEVIRWHSKDSKKATAEDVAEGWILLKQYQDNGDYQSAVEVAKKMRDIGTTAGQTVQAYNILSRLTPEGMFYYAQSELDEAYNRMVEGKSKKWIEKNQSNFNLTPEETQSILDIMKDVSTMEDGYNKKVKIAEIQKMITDKIPPTAGQSIKAWMRISMLFNPKTQVRNVMGNAVIMPVNMFSDSVSAGIDKLISKKTGVRTIGNTNLKNYGKGFGTGLYQSYNDFKKGINTRNIEGNRFEVSEGKNFKNKGIGKALNRVDNLLSFMLDAGDRGFYEATFTNSINNQMILNNVTTPTQEMIDIATNEALQRTWQDNNNYTQSVLKIRNILNNVNIKGYGLGDVIIPFAKTPANLTKAIIDYSPAGLVKTLATDARKLENSLENGQYTAQTQHRFVQNLGKGMAGSFLYVISYALAEAGIATGEADEDKDVKNFIKNSLGINSYSIKIGDKTFSYDWAQPIATPLAIMTNYVKYSKENPDANALEKGINAMNIGTEQLLQQSFMDSLNTVLNGSGTTLENLSQAILELPARAIPTFSKQIADMVDGTQRTTFEYDRPIQSAINSVKAKIPGLSKTLPASVDTLGNEIQKYGGNNNLWNVMFNPANTNKGQLSKAGEEIYNIYKETGDKTIFPRTAPYYINNNNEKVSMTAEQRSRFQTISGKYVENSLNSLLSDKEYKKLSSEEKANIINEIVSDSYLKAKYDVLKIDSKEYEKLRSVLKNVSSASYYSYKFKTKEMKKDSEKIEVLVNSNYNNKEKTALYEQYILSSTDKKYPIIKEAGIDINQYLKYKQQEFTSDKEDDGTLEGKTISGSKKEKVWNYIEGMNLSYTKKLILYSLEYTPSDSQKQQIVNYIESLPGKTKQEKLDILSQFKGFTIYKDGTFKY